MIYFPKLHARVLRQLAGSKVPAIAIQRERDDNILREVPFKVVGFSKWDFLWWTLTALALTGLIYLFGSLVAALLLKGAR